MKLFDWLKPRSKTPSEVSPSALAQMLDAGAVVLPEGALLTPQVQYLEALRIADSLRDFPGDWAWRLKGYQLEHVPTGFVMWVGNEDYGLAEITSHGGKQQFDKPEQQIIWPAVKAWLARGKVGFTGRLPKVRIHGAVGMYWCVADGHPWAGAGESPKAAYDSWARAISIESRKRLPDGQYLRVWGGEIPLAGGAHA